MIYGILFLVLILIITLGAVLISFYLLPAHGQTVPPPNVPTPPANQPNVQVSPPSLASTAPNPNFQYLPQKAYVQAFAPEVRPGTPSVIAPLPQSALVEGQGQPTVIQTGNSGGIDAGSIMGIIGTVVAAGSGLVAKMAKDKANKTEDLTKETMSGTLISKEQIEQLARAVYQMNPEAAAKLTDLPAVKLENLSKDKQEFADKATKS